VSHLNSEHSDRIIDGIKQLHERWNNKLSVPVSELGERYLRSNLSVVLYCSLRDAQFSGGHRFSLTILKHIGDDFQTGSGREREISATCDDHQFPVFIESVHVVDDTNQVVCGVGTSEVWLEAINESEDVGTRNALYFSLVSAQFVFRKRRLPKNRELKCFRVIAPRFRCGEVPNNVIQARPQVMDDLSTKHTESFGECQCSMVIERFLPSLSVWLGNNWVLAFSEESENLTMQVDDILVGPF
jgi:hypothetical protein